MLIKLEVKCMSSQLKIMHIDFQWAQLRKIWINFPQIFCEGVKFHSWKTFQIERSLESIL